VAKSNIERRRLIRAAEQKRDQALVKIDNTKSELAKARLELSRVRKLR